MGLGPGENALFPEPPVQGCAGGEGLEDPHQKASPGLQDPSGLNEGFLHVLHELQHGEEEDHVKAFPGEGKGFPAALYPFHLGYPGLPHLEHGQGRFQPHLPGIGKAPKPVAGSRSHLEEAFPWGKEGS